MFAFGGLGLLMQRMSTQPTTNSSNVSPSHPNEKKVEAAVKETLGDFPEKLTANNAQLEDAHQKGYGEGGKVTASTQKLFANLRSWE